MSEIAFRLAQRGDVPGLARWLVRLCEDPKQHCMHTWSGEDAADLGGLLSKYFDDGELVYVLAFRGESLVGAMGCEIDEELQRGWLHGPHVGLGDWESMAEELSAGVVAALPPSINTLDAYPNTANTRAADFYRRRGFSEIGGVSYVYGMAAEDWVASGGTSCTPLEEGHEPSFLKLYRALFPNAYYSGQRILSMLGSSHRVFVIAEGLEILGFAAGCADEDSRSGEVQFVGVRQDRRGEGLGRRLLQAVVDWLFGEVAVSEVTLNVRQDVPHARSLYERAGFTRRYAGVGLRRAESFRPQG